MLREENHAIFVPQKYYVFLREPYTLRLWAAGTAAKPVAPACAPVAALFTAHRADEQKQRRSTQFAAHLRLIVLQSERED